ncbi:MAG: LamG-like jellyroll fold domain-containing protein, partial [Bacteroidota bacterium]
MKNFTLLLGLLFAMTTLAFAQSGPSGYALEFNGADDYVDLPNNSSFQPTGGNFSAEAWIYIEDGAPDDQKVLMTLGGWSKGYAMNIYKNGNGYFFSSSVYLTGGSFWADGSTSYILTNTWTHVAMTWQQGGNITSYVNGQQVAQTSTTGTYTTSGNSVTMGIGYTNMFFAPFQGKIDEVKVWNTTRTQSQIQSDMSDGTGTGTTAYYKMSDGSGTSLTDNSGNSNTGTLSTPSWVEISYYSAGTGTIGDPYLISSINDLTALSIAVNSGVNYAGKYFLQTADLDLNIEPYNTGTGWPCIGYSTSNKFSGTYEGDNHKISNLFINNSTITYGVGLFGGYMNGTIKNLGLENVNITSTNNGVGAITGWTFSGSTVQNCYVKNGTINGYSYVAGICGSPYTGSIITQCYTSGLTITGHDMVGGIGGYSYGSNINNCYSRSSVIATAAVAGGVLGYNNSTGVLANCYSTGTVSAPSDKGGVLGVQGGSATTTNSFWDYETSGLTSSAAGTMKTTAQMKTLSTFSGATWDFVTTPIWKMDIRNDGYPYLAAQFFVKPIELTATDGTTGPVIYDNLKAAFDAINTGTHQGAITIKLLGNSIESASAVLNASGNGTAAYTSVNIYPTVSGLTIFGNLEAPLIDLNGADNVTIDGRVNATGATKDLVITNTNSSYTDGTSTIRFINDASSNVVQYCTIKGSYIKYGASAADMTGGVVFFSTTNGTTGNNNNLITNNDITSSDNTNRAGNLVYSLGTAGKSNSGNTISNNNIYDFMNKKMDSYGIYLFTNSTDWNVTGNNFYETTTFTLLASNTYSICYPIFINDLSGNNFNVSDNYIGGSSYDHSGRFTIDASLLLPGTYNSYSYFEGIFINVGSTTASSVQNNTIQNITFSTGSSNNSWYGIKASNGNVNIGTITGNTIGSNTGTGSITITNTTSDMTSYGIVGGKDVRNNIIGSFTLANTGAKAHRFIGINLTANTTSVINNTIGSTTQANSIYASSESTNSWQFMHGIVGGGSATITGNTIANMTNGPSNTNASSVGSMRGIYTYGANNTIANNLIRDLSVANANSNSYLDGKASLIGLCNEGGQGSTIENNTIYNLSNTYPSFSGVVVGLFFSGDYSGTNLVSKNFINSLYVTGVSSTAASIYGIKKDNGVCTFANNIVTLGGNSSSEIHGINLSGGSETGTSVYYNTVYINGNPISGSNNSNAFSYTVSSSAAKVIKNNIFVNARSNAGTASGMHYGAYFLNNASITLDYNNYYASGNGGYLGYYNGAYKTTLPIITSQDVYSTSVSPVYANGGGITTSDYLPSNTSLVAITGTGITTDYDGGADRSVTYPAMGAFEYPVIPCFNPSNGGAITSDQAACATLDPLAFESSALPTGEAGTIEYKWQMSTTNSSSGFSDIASSNSETYDPSTLTQTTWYKRIARVTCKSNWTGAAESNVLTMTVDPTTVAGEVTGGATLCGTEVSEDLNLSNYTGSIVKWQSSVSPFDTWVDINNTSSYYSPGTLTETTQFRAVVQSGTCSVENSTATTVTISTDPSSVGGDITGGTGPLAWGANTGTMTLSGQTGVIVMWQKRLNYDTWIDIANTTDTYSETPNASGTWEYRAFVKSGSCSDAYSNTFSIEVSLSPSNIPDSNMWTPNGTVYTIATDANYTYIGGSFTTIGSITGQGVELTTTSTISNPLFPKVDGTIYATAPDGNGGWYIGGSFQNVGSFERNNIAQINSAGEVTDWNPSADDYVNTIAVNGNDVYVGGYFSYIGGEDRSYIAKLNNTDGAADVDWNPSADRYINTIAVSADGADIYAGGNFYNIGGQDRNYIAKLNNTDGTADDTWIADADYTVLSIAISGNDIYAGGRFSTIGGESRSYIAKLNNTDGLADATWDAAANGRVLAIAISGNDIYAGGRFDNIGGEDRYYIAKLNNTDGTADATWDASASDYVYSVATDGTDVYVGGAFDYIGGVSRNYIAKLNNTDGASYTDWNPGANDYVRAIAIKGTDVYVGGDFNMIGGTPRNNIARYINTDNSLDATWNPNANNTVKSIALDGNNVYVGGEFDNIGGQARSYIAKLDNTIGLADATWMPEANSTVKAIAISGNDIYAGGDYTTIGGQARNYIAKLNNTDGSADATWVADANSTVNTLAISGSNIFAGGYFTTIGGLARNYIAKLNNTDGAVDATWLPESNSTVNTIAITGTDIYVGGEFDNIGGDSRNYIAKLNDTDGAADAIWNPSAGYTVYALAVNSTDVYVGGGFDNIGGLNRNYIAKLNTTNGDANVEWNPSANDDVHAIAINGDDNYVGGDFNYIGGENKPYYAKFTQIPCVNPTDGGIVSTSQSGCNPFNPAAFTSTLPTGNSGTLEYKWQYSTTSNAAGFSDIASSNVANFDAGSLTETTWFKRIARVACKTDWTGAVESNVVKIAVEDNLAPVANIATLPNVTGSCTATATAPTATDACAGTITGTTTDALTY